MGESLRYRLLVIAIFDVIFVTLGVLSLLGICHSSKQIVRGYRWLWVRSPVSHSLASLY